MKWTSILAIYALFWVMCAFLLLPFGVQTHDEAGVAKMSKAELPLMFGAVMEDATGPEQRVLLRTLPLPVRLLMRTWGSRHYRRYITNVRGGR